MNFNELQKEKPSALSLNLTAWQAIANIGAQLQKLASAQMGEGSFCPLPPPARIAGPGYDTRSGHTVCELVNEFLLAKARAGRSDRYLRALHNSLSKFIEGRAQSPARCVTAPDIERWMQRRKWAPRTQRGYLSDVRTMFNFAVRRGYMDRNPAAGVELPTLDQKPPQIHSPAQVRAVLEFARTWNVDICRALAVRYFAGLRSAEIERIEESRIQLTPESAPAPDTDGHLEVTALASKTRRRRLVTIQPALRAWLSVGGTLPVIGCQSNIWRDFTAALARETGVPWHHNVTRHSFVSYHLAEFQNAGKTALEAGHSEAMLFAHYRELVTPAASREFWAIRPQTGKSVSETQRAA